MFGLEFRKINETKVKKIIEVFLTIFIKFGSHSLMFSPNIWKFGRHMTYQIEGLQSLFAMHDLVSN